MEYKGYCRRKKPAGKIHNFPHLIFVHPIPVIDLLYVQNRANMSLPKRKTEKTEEHSMKAYYDFEEITSMENLQLKVSSYGAVLRYGDKVLVTDIAWKGFAAAVYEFVESPEEDGLADIECRLSLLEMTDEVFEDGGHAIAWCMEKAK